MDRVRVGILGASGYTGADLVRLLLCHARVEIAVLTADRHAGKPLAAVFPHLHGFALPHLMRIEEADWRDVDVVFCGLPHGTTQEIIAALPQALRIIDLSADFRLDDASDYAQWYGHPHRALGLQATAVYGLTEVYRGDIAKARLVANPGCYPTAALLPLMPLLKAGLVAPEPIIIDAKSGVSGAGRAPKEAMLFGEVGEGVHAYGIGAHRHMPEIEQELAKAAGQALTISFTPHLIPMNRGELVTSYVQLTKGASVEGLREELARTFANEPFVMMAPEGLSPATRHVRGSNRCMIGVFADRRPGAAIVLSAIDNLVKGASGQAIQNMNVMIGFEESTGLNQVALFP